MFRAPKGEHSVSEQTLRTLYLNMRMLLLWLPKVRSKLYRQTALNSFHVITLKILWVRFSKKVKFFWLAFSKS